MGKPTQLDKVLAVLEAERLVLDLAIAKIQAQRQQRDARPKPVKGPKLAEREHA